MWQSYGDDPWVLADWPLLRRRRLSGFDVRVAVTGDGIAVRLPADGFESVLIAGAQAESLLGDPEAAGVERVLVMGPVAPGVAARLGEQGLERRRSWDWYSIDEESDVPDAPLAPPGGRVREGDLEVLDEADMPEVHTLLMGAYPLADRRSSTNGRWWGVRRAGELVAVGAVDTWRGQDRDGSVDWNSHVRSFAVRRGYQGEGLGTSAFRRILAEEWRRTGWVQWSTWADSPETTGLMRSLGLEPQVRVTHFRPRGHASSRTGYPGAETA